MRTSLGVLVRIVDVEPIVLVLNGDVRGGALVGLTECTLKNLRMRKGQSNGRPIASCATVTRPRVACSAGMSTLRRMLPLADDAAFRHRRPVVGVGPLYVAGIARIYPPKGFSLMLRRPFRGVKLPRDFVPGCSVTEPASQKANALRTALSGRKIWF